MELPRSRGRQWAGLYTTLDEAIAVRDRLLAMTHASEPEMHLTLTSPTAPTVAFPTIAIPNVDTTPLESVLTIPDANLLVMCDLHIPHHNSLMLRRAIYITRKYFPHITQYAVIGDSWDWSSLSRHPKNAPAEDIETCLELGAAIYRRIGEYFTDGYICNGNHDERLGLKLDAPFTLQRVFNSAFGAAWPTARMHITNLDYLRVQDAVHPWIIGHPAHYSGMGGKTPADMADIIGCHIATGHNHLIGLSQSKSGKFVGVDVGHMTDEARHYYVKRRLTRYARWNSGFLIISNGYPYHFTERFTDWSSYGC